MKKISLLFGLLLLLVFITACGTEPDLPAASQDTATDQDSDTTTLEKIKEKGEITIAVDDTFPPMNYRNDKNELVGFDVELAKAVAKELGVEANFIPSAWDGIIPGLDAKRYDIIMSTMNITEEREKEVDFVPYLNSGQIVAVPSGNPQNIQSVDDLRGKVVGVQISSTSETAARETEGIKEIKTYNTYTDVFNDLGLGRLDASIVGEEVGRYYETIKPGAFQTVGEGFAKLPVGIAVRKDDDDLQKALQEAVDTIKENGDYAKISEKWFGTDISAN